MCLLAIQYQLVPDAPILVAANREEFYERPSQPPSIQSGKPRVLCGIDAQAGGTWLGVNQHGLVIGVCNRRKMSSNYPSRSRGVLCRELPLPLDTRLELVHVAHFRPEAVDEHLYDARQSM